MGAHVLDETWYRQLLAAGSTTHLVPSLKHCCLEPSPLEVTRYDGSVVTASDYHCIVFFIWHNTLLVL
jgi:hypothetical protein